MNPGLGRFRLFLGGQIAIFLVLLIVRSFFGTGEAEEEYRRIRSQVEGSFLSTDGPPPDAGSVDRAAESAAELSRAVALLEARIDYRVGVERGEGKIVDRNDFAQALIDARNELTAIWKTGQVIPFPPDLGFGSNLPPAESLPGARIQLDLAVAVIATGIRSEVARVLAIDYEPTPREDAAPYLQEVPLKVVIRGSSASIARFVRSIASSEPYASLRDVRMESLPGRDEVDLTATIVALQIQKGEAVDRHLGASGRGGSRSGQPLDELFRR